MTPQKPFDQMNAREKTEFLGFRSYSEREQREREKMFTQRASELTVYFLKTLLSQEELMISRDLSDRSSTTQRQLMRHLIMHLIMVLQCMTLNQCRDLYKI